MGNKEIRHIYQISKDLGLHGIRNVIDFKFETKCVSVKIYFQSIYDYKQSRILYSMTETQYISFVKHILPSLYKVEVDDFLKELNEYLKTTSHTIFPKLNEFSTYLSRYLFLYDDIAPENKKELREETMLYVTWATRRKRDEI